MGYIPNHAGQMVVSSNFAYWNWSTVHLFYQLVATSSMVRIIRPDPLSGYSSSNVVAIDGLDWHTYFPCTGLHEAIPSSLMLKLVFGFSRISEKVFASNVFFRMLVGNYQLLTHWREKLLTQTELGRSMCADSHFSFQFSLCGMFTL